MGMKARKDDERTDSGLPSITQINKHHHNEHTRSTDSYIRHVGYRAVMIHLGDPTFRADAYGCGGAVGGEASVAGELQRSCEHGDGTR
jgi:hypothetical protein